MISPDVHQEIIKILRTPIDRLKEVLTFRLSSNSNSTKTMHVRMEGERRKDQLKALAKVAQKKAAARKHEKLTSKAGEVLDARRAEEQ